MSKEVMKCLDESIALHDEYGKDAHILTIDNPDWDRINDALTGWKIASLVVPDKVVSMTALHRLAEIIYAMGYERGWQSVT